MAVTNKAMIIRRELFSRITKLLMEGRLVEQIDRMPIELRPKNGELSRCCVYKDRAMLKYKIMALLGFSTREDDEEITPLSTFAARALERDAISDVPLTVVDEACSACVRANYVVTNMCRGCVARPCIVNCPKHAIRFDNGKAEIDSKQCVNCGLCMKNCPFHAIVYTPVPCEESCPVGAISKDDEGIEHIDDTKCIYCGRCIMACPFGAVMEKSHLVEVVKAIKDENRKVVAMVAPAIAGQFKAPLGSIITAIRQLGFDDVIEVAAGADVTTANEAAEFVEKMAEGQAFMTTSCCPSYTEAARKHIPEVMPYVSHTRTPLYYTAQIARERYPDATLVFIGPCLAKRYEVYKDPNADYMVSFEELGAMFVAMNINVTESEQEQLDASIDGSSRGYAVAGGVLAAVRKKLGDKVDIKPHYISCLDKTSIKELRAFALKPTANMVEVMACESGCVNGCNVVANNKVAARQVRELAEK